MKNLSVSMVSVLALSCGIMLGSGCNRANMKESEVTAMFDKVGGIAEINEEASAVFRVFRTNQIYILQDYGVPCMRDYPEIKTHPEITNLPALLALGDLVMVQRPNPPSLPQIYVRSGVHRRARVIHILPPDVEVTDLQNMSTFMNQALFMRVAPNIFVER